MASLVNAPTTATPVPQLPFGEPADTPISEAVTLTVRQIESSLNAGDMPRLSTLFTEYALRGGGILTKLELEDPPESAPGLTANGIARWSVIGPWDVQLLEDSRMATAVLIAEPWQTLQGRHGRRSSSSPSSMDRGWSNEEIREVQVAGRRKPKAVGQVIDPPPLEVFQ